MLVYLALCVPEVVVVVERVLLTVVVLRGTNSGPFIKLLVSDIVEAGLSFSVMKPHKRHA